MTTERIVTMEDDLTGEPATQTIAFSVGADAYEIDLSDRNAEKMFKALMPFVTKGRRVGRVVVPRGKDKLPGKPTLVVVREGEVDPVVASVRAWARANGHNVSGRGRVSAALTAMFKEAGN